MKRTVTIDGPTVSRKRSRSAARSRRPSVALQVKRILDKRVEQKFIDTTTNITLSATSYVQTLNVIGEGTDYNTRIGRHIAAKAIMIDITFLPGTVANVASNADYGIIALVWDKQPNGAVATYANIFSGPTAQPFPNMNNSDRFKILKLENFYIQPKFDAAGSLESPSFQEPAKRRWYVPLRDMDVEYGSSTTPTTGSVYLCVGGTAPSSPSQFYYNARFLFTDM